MFDLWAASGCLAGALLGVDYLCHSSLCVGGDDSGSAMQLRMPQPGQRLLPPVAPPAPPLGAGDDAVRWSWMDCVGRRRSNSGLTSSLEGDETDSSSEESSSSEGDSEGESEGAAAAGGARLGGGSGCGSGSGGSQRRQQLTLQQQMEREVHNTGGLLAAVARRLDGMAWESARPAAAAAAGSSSSGSGVPFEQTLLTLVAQAQRLLRCVGAVQFSTAPHCTCLPAFANQQAPLPPPQLRSHAPAVCRCCAPAACRLGQRRMRRQRRGGVRSGVWSSK